MSVKAVIGLNYGDCGKGVATEYLCSQNPDTIVVRFSGGHQAGHKVIKGGVEHVFSSFGAGTLSGCPTYWDKNCTIEPVAFWNEFKILRDKCFAPKIFIHPDCPVTTIYDVFANRQSVEIKHGTTGTGFFRTKKRHADGVSFTANTLFRGSMAKCNESILEVKKYYNFVEDLDTDVFINAIFNIRSMVNKNVFITDQVPNYQHKVFEGSQGLMLDEHIGYMPHCTPSDLTPRNVPNLDEVFLVTRAYQTRHGLGPMTNEDVKLKLINNEKETNVFNKYQGEFRAAPLDLDQLIHAKTKGIDQVVSENVKVNLVVTCVDQLTQYLISQNKKMLCFDKPIEFVKLIGKSLNLNGDLYINDSPYSTTIKAINRL